MPDRTESPRQAQYALNRSGFFKNWLAVVVPTLVAVSCAFLWHVASLSAAFAMVVVLVDQRKVVKAYLTEPTYGPKYKRFAQIWLLLAAISATAALLSLGAHLLRQ